MQVALFDDGDEAGGNQVLNVAAVVAFWLATARIAQVIGYSPRF